MTQEYGWYYEEEHVQDTDGDLWDLIDSAVREAVEDERLDGLRVGPMVDHKPSDFLDDDTIELNVASKVCVDPGSICEEVNAQIYDLVTDGSARLKEDFTAPEFDPSKHEDIRAWADANIELEPTRSCDGRYPLPIDLVNGQWRFGSDDSENKEAAWVTYATVPSPEGGYEGWYWFAGDDTGEAKTLKEAMRAAEEALKPKPKTPIYAYVPDIGFFPPEPHKPLGEEVIHTTIGGKGVVGRIKR